MELSEMNSTNATLFTTNSLNPLLNIPTSCPLPFPTTRMPELFGTLCAIIPALAYPFTKTINKWSRWDYTPQEQLGCMSGMSLSIQLAAGVVWLMFARPVAYFQPWVLPLTVLCFVVYLRDDLAQFGPRGTHPRWEKGLRMTVWGVLAYSYAKATVCRWDRSFSRTFVLAFGVATFLWLPLIPQQGLRQGLNVSIRNRLRHQDLLMTELIDRLRLREFAAWWWLPDEDEGEEHPAWAAYIGWFGHIAQVVSFLLWIYFIMKEEIAQQHVSWDMGDDIQFLTHFTCFCG